MRWHSDADWLIDDPEHQRMLSAEADRLKGFFAQPSGRERFFWRRIDGSIDVERPVELYAVARLVHCFSIAQMLSEDQSGDDQTSDDQSSEDQAGGWAADGVDLLLSSFVDPRGGFITAIAADGASVSDNRSAYAHAFVLLAGATATAAGIPGSRELFDRALDAIDVLFWDQDAGAAVDEVDPQGNPASDYRGQNANMHLTEAYLAAFELTGDVDLLRRARGLAERFVLSGAAPREWRVPEHYDRDWQVDEEFGRDQPYDQFRPFGVTPGHGLEWSRLILNIAAHDPTFTRAEEAARGLFSRAVQDGWDTERGGFCYTTDFRGDVVHPARMHWVLAEALGAAIWLARTTGSAEYVTWYRRFWEWTDQYVIDRDGGSWWHELDTANRPTFDTWPGKPDLYHAYQAVLTPRLDRPIGIAAAAQHRL